MEPPASVSEASSHPHKERCGVRTRLRAASGLKSERAPIRGGGPGTELSDVEHGHFELKATRRSESELSFKSLVPSSDLLENQNLVTVTVKTRNRSELTPHGAQDEEYEEATAQFYRQAWLEFVQACCPRFYRFYERHVLPTVLSIIDDPRFDQSIIFCILVGSVMLALDRPGDSDIEKWAVVTPLDITLTQIFTLEAILKFMATGPAYFKDNWNILDILVVIEGWMSMPWGGRGGGDSGMKVLRCFRVLRPLRTVKRFPSLRILTSALIHSLSMLGDICVITFFVTSCLGVVAILLWKGKYTRRCYIDCLNVNTTSGACLDAALNLTADSDEEDRWIADQLCELPLENPCKLFEWYRTDPYQCEQGQSCREYGRNPNYGFTSFDQMGYAWLALFQVATLEGWSSQVGMAADVYTPQVWFYFLMVVILASFALFQLVGAIILARLQGVIASETAAAVKEAKLKLEAKRAREREQLEKKQKRLEKRGSFVAAESGPSLSAQLMKCIEAFTPPAWTYEKPLTTNKTLYDFTIDRHDADGMPITALCSKIIYLCIFLNIVTLSIDSYKINPVMALTLKICDETITIIFAVEMLLKMAVMGLRSYVNEETMDMVITIGCLFEFAMKSSSGLSALRVVRIFRVFRVLRVLRMGPRFEAFTAIIQMIADVAEPVGNVCVLLALFMFIYAILGVQLFGLEDAHVDWLDEDTRYNFHSFTWAWNSVFVMLTGENWPGIQFNAIGNLPDGGSLWYALFFVSWIVLGNYFLVNLVLAILLSNSTQNMDKKGKVKTMLKVANYRNFVKKRSCFDIWRRKARDAHVVEMQRNSAAKRVQARMRSIISRNRQHRFRTHLGISSQDSLGEGELDTDVGGLSASANKAEELGKAGTGGQGGSSESSLRTAERRHSLGFYVEEGVVERRSSRNRIVLEYARNFSRDWDAKEAAARAGLDVEHLLAARKLVRWARAMNARPSKAHVARQEMNDKKLALQIWRQSHPTDMGVRAPRELADAIHRVASETKNIDILRDLCTQVLCSELYLNFILCAIVLGTLAMLWEPTPETKAKTVFEIFLTLIYGGDVLMKGFSQGWLPREADSLDFEVDLLASHGLNSHTAAKTKIERLGFFADPWNTLDFVVSVGSVCFIIAKAAGAPMWLIGFFYVIRGGRPLRLIHHIESCKGMVTALVNSAGSLRDLTIVLFAFTYISAIMGMQLFKGALWHCQDTDFPQGVQFNATNVTGHNGAFFPDGCTELRNANFHFDDIGNSFLSIFLIIMLEGWPTVALSAVDSKQAGTPAGKYMDGFQPEKDYSEYAFFFFMGVIIIGSFLIMQLFITVVFENFISQRCQFGAKTITPAQLDLIEFEDRLIFDTDSKKLGLQRAAVLAAGNEHRAHIEGAWSHLVRGASSIKASVWYDRAVIVAVVVNVFILMITHEGQSYEFEQMQEYIGVMCSLVFLLELAVEVTVLGVCGYLSSAEEWVNFVVCVVATVDVVLFLGGLCQGDNPFIKVIRCLRITRMFKLFGPIPSLRVLLIAVLRPFPTLAAIFVLLFLLVTTMANFAYTMFRHIDMSEVGRHINFRTMYNAIVTLFYFVTGENYVDVMVEVRKAVPEGCPQWLWHFACVIYFTSFILIMNFLVLNMFIMVVVDSYELVSNTAYGMTQEDIIAFCELWDKVNTNADPLLMDESTFRKLLRVLPQSIVHYDKVSTSYKQLRCLLYEVDIYNFRTAKLTFLGEDHNHFAQRREDGLLHFHRVLLALNRVILLNKDLGETFTTRSDHAAISQHSAVSMGHINAFRIQYRWRARREARRWAQMLKMGQVVLDTMEKEHIGAMFNEEASPRSEETDSAATNTKGGHLREFYDRVPIHKLHLLGHSRHHRAPSPIAGLAQWKERDAEMSQEQRASDAHAHALEVLSRGAGLNEMMEDGIMIRDRAVLEAAQRSSEGQAETPREGAPKEVREPNVFRVPRTPDPLARTAEGPTSRSLQRRRTSPPSRSPSGVALRPASKPAPKRHSKEELLTPKEELR